MCAAPEQSLDLPAGTDTVTQAVIQGRVLSGADAVKKMAAGASLVQIYTGLIYRGPELIGECVEAIRRRKEAPSRGNLPNL